MGKLNNLYLSLDWTLTKPFSLVQALGECMIYIVFKCPGFDSISMTHRHFVLRSQTQIYWIWSILSQTTPIEFECYCICKLLEYYFRKLLAYRRRATLWILY